MTKWISIKDELPATDCRKEYLFYNGKYAMFGKLNMKLDGSFFITSVIGFHIDFTVTHWLKIPKFPKKTIEKGE
jgi:hypothetical protein